MAREVDQRTTDSVFDFLYVDHRKIGLFLSQFSEFGDLTDIVHSTSVTDDSKLAGGLKGLVSAESKTGEKEAVERRYRAHWSQALNFLDEVHARKMIGKEISATRLGRLVLADGDLLVASMQPFAKTWGAIAQNQNEQRPQGNRHARRRAGKAQDALQSTEESSQGLNILGSLEQPVFMVLKGDGKKLWSTLEPDFLIGGSADLNLKHGLRLTGRWHVLGILDCEPGPQGDAGPDRLCGGGYNELSDSVKEIWREFGMVFGRPEDCYGITPLIIMREIS
ncbi:hypothetical protein [Stappia sp. MMSF_3263]|uniref:hypothetical protein n=1 Tax=Stappia sp. MMSF_3263 TaxID=3046693 RepID=UPI00273E4C03|nr:hypothetical protein [Stappia sp. MMSF_3263]